MGALYQVYSEKEFYQSLFNLGYEFDAKDYDAAQKARDDSLKNKG